MGTGRKICAVEFEIAVDLGALQIDLTIRTEAPVEVGFAANTSQAQAQRRVSTREVSCGAVQLPVDLRAVEINLAERSEPVTQKDISVDRQPLALEGFPLQARRPGEIFSDPATNKLKVGDFGRSQLDALWEKAFLQNDGEIYV